MPDDDPKKPTQKEVLASQMRRSRLARRNSNASEPAPASAPAQPSVNPTDLSRETIVKETIIRPSIRSDGPAEKSAAPNPSSETASPMHARDRRLYVILAWSAIPAALVVGCYIAWGSSQLPGTWAFAGIAVGILAMAAATIYALEKKPPSPKYPGPIVLAVATLTWALIGWQTWLWLYAPMQGYTKDQFDKAVADAKASVPPVVIHDPLTADQIAKAAESELKKRDDEIADLKRKLAEKSSQGSGTTNPAPAPKSARSVAEIERIKSRLSDLYDLINSEGKALLQGGTDMDRIFAGPQSILKLGGTVDARNHALAAKEQITKLGQDVEKFISARSHDADALNRAIGNYQSAIYDFRNAMEDYAGSIPDRDQSAEQLLNNSGLWGSYDDLKVRAAAFRKWLADVLSPSGGIKGAEADLDQELKNAH